MRKIMKSMLIFNLRANNECAIHKAVNESYNLPCVKEFYAFMNVSMHSFGVSLI